MTTFVTYLLVAVGILLTCIGSVSMVLWLVNEVLNSIFRGRK